jgi:predicted dehydrogenase
MMAPRPADSKEDFPLPEVETDWTDLYRNLIEVMNGRETLIIKPGQVRRVLQVIEAIFRSAKEERSVDVSI